MMQLRSLRTARIKWHGVGKPSVYDIFQYVQTAFSVKYFMLVNCLYLGFSGMPTCTKRQLLTAKRDQVQVQRGGGWI